MSRIVIGVSGLNAVDNPGPGIGVARSLAEDDELEVEVVGLAYNALEPGIYMDWVIGRSFTLPYPGGGAAEYLARLKAIQAAVGLEGVIPCLDAELPLYLRFAAELEAQGIRTYLPSMAQFRLRAKDRLTELAENARLRLPKTVVVHGEADLMRAVEEIGLPLFVKGVFYEARRAPSWEDALRHYRGLLAEWGGPVVAQEIIAGDELNVVGLGDGTGQSLGMVCAKKTYVTALGKMWGGVTVRHPAMLGAAERFLRAQKWRGPFELECIVREDDVYLIEINPRFPAWVYFATAVGVNLPARLIRRMLGRPCETHSNYDAGQLFLRYSYDMVAPGDRFQRTLTLGQTA